VVPAPHGLWLRWTLFLSGVVLNAVATGMYIGAGLGAGPRDGLTTAIAARGRSIRVVRTGVELSVLLMGWLLGGNVGLGTVVYAVGIGPLVHLTIPALRLKSEESEASEQAAAAPRGRARQPAHEEEPERIPSAA
jgi:uncharacterized membrane protein YczE